MSKHTLKKSFESGDLNGFQVGGRCHVSVSIPTPNGTLKARSGLFFAVIDDPSMANQDGVRLPGPPPVLKTRNYRKTGTDGLMTIGVNGAMLALNHVQVAKNATIRFWWAFIGKDKREGCNDFALFEIVDEDNNILHRRWLCETRFSLFESWTVFQHVNDFEGTVNLRWVSSNGRTAIDEDEVEQAFHRTYPCTLLLDAIEII